ncbi:hypothetical protein FQR65_LT16510 [Abscondita terminalis]|nr:hypothetical protein FQR65_LT16510 [Abscondita terminalis]
MAGNQIEQSNCVLEQLSRLDSEVRDDGIGIAPDKAKTDSSRLSSSEGRIYPAGKVWWYGTWISICRVATLLGGRIALESEPDKGSTFTFILPYRPAQKIDIHAKYVNKAIEPTPVKETTPVNVEKEVSVNTSDQEKESESEHVQTGADRDPKRKQTKPEIQRGSVLANMSHGDP